MDRNLLGLLGLDTATVIVGWIIYLANVPPDTTLFLFAAQTILILGLISLGFTFFYSFVLGGLSKIFWIAIVMLAIGAVVTFFSWFVGGIVVLAAVLLLIFSRERGARNYVPLSLLFSGFVVLTLIPPIEAMLGISNILLDYVLIIIATAIILVGVYLSLKGRIAIESYLGYLALSLTFFLLPPYHEIFRIRSNGSYGIYDTVIILISTMLFTIFLATSILAMRRLSHISQEVEKGYGELYRGEWEKAHSTFKSLYDRGYDEDSVLNGLGVALMHMGKYEESEKYLLRALKIQERDEYRTNLGNLYYRRGDINRAMEIYKRVLKRNPNCYIALNNIARCLIRKGRLNEAEKYLKRAMKVNPQGNMAKENYKLIKNEE